MIIYREEKMPKNNATMLKYLCKILWDIKSLIVQFVIVVGGSQLKELVYAEGTWEDRLLVDKIVKELLVLIASLTEFNIAFTKEDVEKDIHAKQASLKEAASIIESINAQGQILWSMRNSAEVPENNQKIQDTLKKIFAAANTVIQDLDDYVKKFNKNSNVKLSFKVKWTKLPK